LRSWDRSTATRRDPSDGQCHAGDRGRLSDERPRAARRTSRRSARRVAAGSPQSGLLRHRGRNARPGDRHTVATAVACGVVPAVRLARTAPVEALREQSRSATGTRGQARLRSGLAIAQVALALTLLVGAGVLMASVHRLHRVDLGFRTDRILTFEVNLPTARYSPPRRTVPRGPGQGDSCDSRCDRGGKPVFLRPAAITPGVPRSSPALPPAR
jgi:hypothetical protein